MTVYQGGCSLSHPLHLIQKILWIHLTYGRFHPGLKPCSVLRWWLCWGLWNQGHMQREPSGFWGGYVNKDTHSIGSVTGVVMPWSTIPWRGFSIASLHSMETFLLVCWTGEQEGSRQIVYTPGMLPVVSNEFKNAFLWYTMSCTSFTENWSCNGAIFWHWIVLERGYGAAIVLERG